MANNLFTDISSLDFEARKASLKNFLKTNTEFTNFDYEGSTMNMLLDVLAYNSYQDSFLTNMVANESYLDTAQLRPNVVSKAKALNYLPRSARAASVKVNISFNPNDTPEGIVIPKGTRFFAAVDGQTYNFVTIQEYLVTPVDDNYTREITLYDGDFITQTFTYNATTGSTKFYLFNENVDTNTITVTSRPTVGSTTITTWVRVQDITDITASTPVYYVEEDINGLYAVYFGDGVLGQKPANGTIFSVEHLVCSAGEANGITSLTNDSYSGYNRDIPTTTYFPSAINIVEAATGGQPKESIDSIRFNAPRNYARQNRLVVAEDYISFIRENFTDIQSVNFWGGQDNVPPIYGKVFIACKPFNGYTLTNLRKEEIAASCQKFNVKTIEPVVVDPSFIYINPTILVRYDPLRTTLSPDLLHANIGTAIREYELNTLGIFDSAFRFSALVKLIDNVNVSIISNEMELKLEKRFVPIINSTINYKISFNRQLEYPYPGYLGSVETSGFITPLSAETAYLDDDGLGKLRMYYFDQGTKVYINNNAGTVDYITGEVYINELLVTSIDTEEIRVRVKPLEKDVVPIRNEMILISSPTLAIYNNNLASITYSGTFDTEGTTTSIFNDLSTNTVYV